MEHGATLIEFKSEFLLGNSQVVNTPISYSLQATELITWSLSHLSFLRYSISQAVNNKLYPRFNHKGAAAAAARWANQAKAENFNQFHRL